MFLTHSKFSSPATDIFVLSDKNRAVCARFKSSQLAMEMKEFLPLCIFQVVYVRIVYEDQMSLSY